MMRHWCAPCVNCPDKGCGPKHSTCDEYQDYLREIDEEKKREKKDMIANSYILGNLYKKGPK